MSCNLNIILDLDNTIINSITYNRMKYVPKNIELESVDIGDFITFKRPNLDIFLDFLFSNFNVGVYTLGSRDYAEDIVWNFIQNKPGRKVDFILSREDEYINATSPKYMGLGLTKNLRFLWEDLKIYDYYPCNTFIIDDNPSVKATNPYNTIHVNKFEVLRDNNSYNNLSSMDNVLLEVIKELMKIKTIYIQNKCDIKKRNTRCQNTLIQPILLPDFIDVKKLGRFYPQDL
jgi:hypothetical protein